MERGDVWKSQHYRLQRCLASLKQQGYALPSSNPMNTCLEGSPTEHYESYFLINIHWIWLFSPIWSGIKKKIPSLNNNF